MSKSRFFIASVNLGGVRQSSLIVMEMEIGLSCAFKLLFL